MRVELVGQFPDETLQGQVAFSRARSGRIASECAVTRAEPVFGFCGALVLSPVGRQILVRVEFREVTGCRQMSGRRSVRDPTYGVLTVNAEPARTFCGPHV